MKVLVLTSLAPELNSQLQKRLPKDLKLVFKDHLSDTEIQSAFKEADIVFGNPPSSWVQSSETKLKFLQLDSTGFDQYEGINLPCRVANMGDHYARPCAETIVGGILAFYRHIHELITLQRREQWVGKSIRPKLELLADKDVLILGFGNIGRTVLGILSGFGASIKTVARNHPAADLHSYEDVLATLPKIDLVVNTLPGTADKYVSHEFFAALKTGSLYASVGRGNTTDEEALLDALRSHKLAGAVLDVTKTEPLPSGHPLWKMDNVILTQHSGGGQQEEDEGKVSLFLSNVNKFLRGEALKNEVNLARGY